MKRHLWISAVCSGALLAPMAAQADKTVRQTDVQTNISDPMAREAEPIRHHSGEQEQRREVITPTGGEHRSLLGDDADYSVHGRTVDQTAVPSNAAATFRDAKTARGGGPTEHGVSAQGIKESKGARGGGPTERVPSAQGLKEAKGRGARSSGSAWDASDKQTK